MSSVLTLSLRLSTTVHLASCLERICYWFHGFISSPKILDNREIACKQTFPNHGFLAVFSLTSQNLSDILYGGTVVDNGYSSGCFLSPIRSDTKSSPLHRCSIQHLHLKYRSTDVHPSLRCAGRDLSARDRIDQQINSFRPSELSGITRLSFSILIPPKPLPSGLWRRRAIPTGHLTVHSGCLVKGESSPVHPRLLHVGNLSPVE